MPVLATSQESSVNLRNEAFHLTINRPAQSPYSRWLHLVYSEIFRRLGQPLIVSFMPLKRATVELEMGRIDGESARIYEYALDDDQIIRVDEYLYYMTVAAFAINEMSLDHSWKSFESADLLIDYPRGMRICELNMAEYENGNSIHSVTGTLYGLKKLLASHSEVYIEDLFSVDAEKLELPEEDQKKIRMVGIMEKVPLYMHIHVRFRFLKPELERVIKEMKEEGMMEKLRIRAFEPISGTD